MPSACCVMADLCPKSSITPAVRAKTNPSAGQRAVMVNTNPGAGQRATPWRWGL